MQQDMIKYSSITYIPSGFLNVLSEEALGVIAWLICKANMIPAEQRIPFSAIIEANRGSSYKVLFKIMDELVARKFFTSHADALWVITIPQPHGELKIFVEDDSAP